MEFFLALDFLLFVILAKKFFHELKFFETHSNYLVLKIVNNVTGKFSSYVDITRHIPIESDFGGCWLFLLKPGAFVQTCFVKEAFLKIS